MIVIIQKSQNLELISNKNIQTNQEHSKQQTFQQKQHVCIPKPYKSIITNIINSHSQDTILQQVSHLHFNIQQTKQLQVKFPKQPLLS